MQDGEDYLLGAGRVTDLDRKAREEICLYDEEIVYVDAKIGEVLDALSHRGVYDDSLIIVTGDHREDLREHRCWDHRFPYEGTIHVPLIMKFPSNLEDLSAGKRRVYGITSHSDLMPAILELCNVTYTPGVRTRPGKELYRLFKL